jgi:hypothetical protein
MYHTSSLYLEYSGYLSASRPTSGTSTDPAFYCIVVVALVAVELPINLSGMTTIVRENGILRLHLLQHKFASCNIIFLSFGFVVI